jgi:Na+/H+ antiporter NhaC
VYILESLNDPAHLSIIVFSMMIGAMVALISSNGGMKGVVNILARYARSPRSGQFVTWLLGMAVFFDDYANTLVVGNTMRPVTDRLNISREKLSYIVDSTAAPIAAIAFVTTWIGAELSYIQDGINVIGLKESAYDIFLNSLQFSFYPVLALLFILILVKSNRDFGPMLQAERNARKNIYPGSHPNAVEESIDSTEGKERWYNAVIPVVVIVAGTITGLVSTGLQNVSWDDSMGFFKNLSLVIGNADSYKALLWSSLAGVIIAVILTLSQKLLTLKGSVNSLVEGFKTMLTAVIILVLAWSIALITKYMHTADFVAGILVSINMAPFVLPSIVFMLAAFVAFSTGSSWGTMAILYPLVLPSSWLISQQYGLDHEQSMNIFYNVVSTVLAGSVLGDHCSPISDTTILSSLACSCNHIEHVRTQLPYAMTVGVIAILFGTLPAAYGVPTYILFPLCLVVLYLIVRFFGKKTEEVV